MNYLWFFSPEEILLDTNTVSICTSFKRIGGKNKTLKFL